MRIRWVLLAGVAVVLLTSCGASDTYDAEEARAAFETQGWVLVEPPPDPAGSALNPLESGKPTFLAPRDGAPFFVFVGTATDADDVWAGYEPDHGPRTFDARRANVLVLSDHSLDASQRRQIRAALAALPDRGSPVVVEGAE
jgi:hypothetical protein